MRRQLFLLVLTSLSAFLIAVSSSDASSQRTTLYAWGDSRGGLLGDGANVPKVGRPARGPVALNGDIVSFDANGGEACTVVADGSVFCWGDDVVLPTKVDGVYDAAKVTVGWGYACVLNKSAQVLCWGRNEKGQLGVASSLKENKAPGQVTDIGVAVDVEAGVEHTCAILLDRSVACWGAARDGEYSSAASELEKQIATGAGHVEARLVPGLHDVLQLAASNTYTCALLQSGKVTCWGQTATAALGNGNEVRIGLPIETIEGLDHVTRIAAGFDTACAVIADGTLRCWGGNQGGELGIGVADPWGKPRSRTPVAKQLPVRDLHDAIDVAVGFESVCAVRRVGTVVCWGDNTMGQLGRKGSHIYAPLPVAGLRDVTEIHATDFTMVALSKEEAGATAPASSMR